MPQAVPIAQMVHISVQASVIVAHILDAGISPHYGIDCTESLNVEGHQAYVA